MEMPEMGLGLQREPLAEIGMYDQLELSASFDRDRIPPSADISNLQSPVQNQGNIGSCTAFAVGGAIEHLARRFGVSIDYSERYVYYNTRVKIAGVDPEADVGATRSQAIAAVQYFGACAEQHCRYVLDNPFITLAEEPQPAAYRAGEQRKAIRVGEIGNSLDGIKAAILSGFPVIIGFRVSKNYTQSGSTGVFPFMDGPDAGGHAVLCVGYDDSAGMLKIKNSWGVGWGVNGYGYLPYGYPITPTCYCIYEVQRVNEMAGVSTADKLTFLTLQVRKQPKDNWQVGNVSATVSRETAATH